jgi:hypothetical protein
MGCVTSSEVSDSRKASNIKTRHTLLSSGINTKCVNKLCSVIKLDQSSEIREFTVTGESRKFDLKYCYVAQRGFYPKSPDKANQDSYMICEKLLNDPDTHLFGIFDGHGTYGDYCSHYAADQVPEHLVRELKSGIVARKMANVDMEKAHAKSFLNANYGMHKVRKQYRSCYLPSFLESLTSEEVTQPMLLRLVESYEVQ